MTTLSGYEDWLALTDEEQDRLHYEVWSVYDWEGRKFAMMAASRFLFASQIPIKDISVGIWHGGQYILHATVANKDISSCPPRFSQRFEGFRILWTQETYEFKAADAEKLVGDWFCDNSHFDYRISVRLQDGQLCVKALSTSGVEVQSNHVEFNGDRLEFEVAIPSLNANSLQRFSVFEGIGENPMLVATTWRKRALE